MLLCRRRASAALTRRIPGVPCSDGLSARRCGVTDTVLKGSPLQPTTRREDGCDETLVLGGGPAGLTAAYILARAGREVTVVERDQGLGGIARTEVRDGYRFDLGGHRFFTKAVEVRRLWREILGEEFLTRPRMSRIYYDGQFLRYPLDARDVMRRLGPLELSRALGSYLVAAVRPRGEEATFEQWVTNRFGRRLFDMFFRSYTEKVWGVPCSELRAEWAAQRIRGLSFTRAARAALFPSAGREVKSLIEEFEYPRLGPGQMWEAMSDRILERGGRVMTDAPVTRLGLSDGRVTEVDAGGETFAPTEVISSLALADLVELADPAPPREVVQAGRGLRYRDFLVVALVLHGGDDPFPDNWIYIHDPDVEVARIQNFRTWSPDMVPDASTSCVGMEYFCFRADERWSMADSDLVELAAGELEAIGLAARERVSHGYVVRVPRAYPIYDAHYAARVATLRAWLDQISNLQQVGRNGLHRYNNSDHSMLTAMRAVENMDGADHDLWSINADSWYHETQQPEEHPYLPGRIPAVALEGAGSTRA